MKVIADLSVLPLDGTPSYSDRIATCEQILADCGLKGRIHAHGTNVEGEWGDVMKALEQCHQALHDSGISRIESTLKIETRTDREESIDTRIERVMQKA